VDEVAHQEAASEQTGREALEPANVPFHLRPIEEKEAAIAEFRKFCDENFVPDADEIMALYMKERAALRKIYPGTFVDLGRQGVIKVRALGKDGWYDVEPEVEADS